LGGQPRPHVTFAVSHGLTHYVPKEKKTFLDVKEWRIRLLAFSDSSSCCVLGLFLLFGGLLWLNVVAVREGTRLKVGIRHKKK
jgi:hypothetical protein